MTRSFDPYVRFSIVEPLASLSERRLRGVMISKGESDITRMAAAICSAIHHLPEQIEEADPVLAGKIRALSGFAVCMDVSDTAKHKRLRRREREVSLEGHLAFEFTDDEPPKYRFLRTNITATNGVWGAVDLAEVLFQIAQEILLLLSIPVIVSGSDAPMMSHFQSKVIVEEGSESFMVKDIGLQFYRRAERDGLVLADPPIIDLEIYSKNPAN